MHVGEATGHDRDVYKQKSNLKVNLCRRERRERRPYKSTASGSGAGAVAGTRTGAGAGASDFAVKRT